MAWSRVWETEGRPPGGRDVGDTSLEYIVEDSRTFWYVPRRRLIISYWPREGSQYFVTSCPPEEKVWPTCIRLFDDATAVKPTLRDLLLGWSLPVKRLAGAKTCHWASSGRDHAHWKPSPNSPTKRSLIANLKSAITEFPATNGRLTNLVIADFNVLDPKVFAVVDIESEGRQWRALAVARINAVDQSVEVVSLHDEGLVGGTFVAEVLAKGIPAI
jgi:hypothetical protein